MQIQKTLKLAFSISFAVLILLGTIMYFAGIKLTVLDQATSINLQQSLILLILIGIPGVLVWSKKKVQLLREIRSLDKRLEEYKKIELIRLFVFDFLGLLTFIVQLLSDYKGIAMLFLIILFLFMFIWPTLSRLEQETGSIEVDTIINEKESSGEAAEKEDPKDGENEK